MTQPAEEPEDGAAPCVCQAGAVIVACKLGRRSGGLSIRFHMIWGKRGRSVMAVPITVWPLATMKLLGATIRHPKTNKLIVVDGRKVSVVEDEPTPAPVEDEATPAADTSSSDR